MKNPSIGIPKKFIPPHTLTGLAKDSSLLVAYSGGADSGALLHMVLAYAAKHGAKVYAAHVASRRSTSSTVGAVKVNKVSSASFMLIGSVGCAKCLKFKPFMLSALLSYVWRESLFGAPALGCFIAGN